MVVAPVTTESAIGITQSALPMVDSVKALIAVI
jgi:hypothetical protein